jgi:hypothetical protein
VAPASGSEEQRAGAEPSHDLGHPDSVAVIGTASYCHYRERL